LLRTGQPHQKPSPIRNYNHEGSRIFGKDLDCGGKSDATPLSNFQPLRAVLESPFATKSGVALRFPPQSKTCCGGGSAALGELVFIRGFRLHGYGFASAFSL
jgi:hypothetical protein